MTRFPSFLRLNSFNGWMPLYVHTTSSLSTHRLTDTWVASTSWLLWIMLLWTWVYTDQFKFLLSIFLGTFQGVELLDHMLILFLIFWGNAIIFSMVAVPIYIPTNSAQCFLANTCYFLFFDSSHPNRSRLVSHWGFGFHFPNGYWRWPCYVL